jgi:hypothetical protein
MFWWAVLGACWIWLAAGPEGIQMAIGMVGLAVLGLATAKLLDYVAKDKDGKGRSQEMRIWKPRQVHLNAFARRPRVRK